MLHNCELRTQFIFHFWFKTHTETEQESPLYDLYTIVPLHACRPRQWHQKAPYHREVVVTM